jgi:hypothetical protein
MDACAGCEFSPGTSTEVTSGTWRTCRTSCSFPSGPIRAAATADALPEELYEPMRCLLDDAGLAQVMGGAARAFAREHFSIDRFVRDWNCALAEVA